MKWALLVLAAAIYLGWLAAAWDEVRHNALRRARQRAHQAPAAAPDPPAAPPSPPTPTLATATARAAPGATLSHPRFVT
jgi:hypothetical protein